MSLIWLYIGILTGIAFTLTFQDMKKEQKEKR
jgi:hypothetical protein